MNENIDPNQARVNVTYSGSNGDLPDTVFVDSNDADIKAWVTEAVRTGSIPGIQADPNANFGDFVVDRFGPTEQRAYSLIAIRPKTPFGTLGIGQAVDAMRDGKRIARAGWNGKSMWLALQVPDANSKMTEPYVYMKTAQGGLIPWLCSQADLLALDWEIVED